VQKSIFAADIDECRFAKMRRRVESTMVREDDGVKCFPLCDRCADTLAALGLCKVVAADEYSPLL
jgi:CRISPR-associated protein Cas2